MKLEILICCFSYKQAFFDKDYISSHPEDTERITHLKDLMQEQVRLCFKSSPDPADPLF